MYGCKHIPQKRDYTLLGGSTPKPKMDGNVGYYNWILIGKSIYPEKYAIVEPVVLLIFNDWQNELDKVNPDGRMIEFRRCDNHRKADIKVVLTPRVHKSVLYPDENNFRVKCDYSFDGQGSVLAHAWKMGKRWHVSGHVHVDIDDVKPDMNLYEMIGHEVGHALGLGHSEHGRALMGEYYSGSKRGMHKDDRNGLSAIFGKIKRDILNKRIIEDIEGKPNNLVSKGTSRTVDIVMILAAIVLMIVLFSYLKS